MGSRVHLTAEEVLSHPWITSGGSTLILHTPRLLNKHHESLRTLEEFANKIMEVNRAMEPAVMSPFNPSNTEPLDFPMEDDPPSPSTFLQLTFPTVTCCRDEEERA